jgi:hypothetical protein
MDVSVLWNCGTLRETADYGSQSPGIEIISVSLIGHSNFEEYSSVSGERRAKPLIVSHLHWHADMGNLTKLNGVLGAATNTVK